MTNQLHKALEKLEQQLEGELYFDQLMRVIYATDASVYRELPLAVAYPKHADDIRQLIGFAHRYNTSLIPRAAGTSLAGQCVGNGIVVDVSKYMNKVLEINEKERWVRVQPGIIRDELNHYLKPYGLFFGPNTSTANRAMIGGMVGNNSCGSYSIVYGTTRDHTLEIEAFLSDGSTVKFEALDKADFRAKCIGTKLENQLYRHIHKELSHPETQREIRLQFPKPEIHRRNTGYAVDELLNSTIFSSKSKEKFNFCKLLTGSEGTLAFSTAIKLHLDPLPPKEKVLLCAHFHSVDEALRAVLVVQKHSPRAIELMDKIVMDCTKDNIEQQKNRFFVKGDPQAILIIEFGAEVRKEVTRKANELIDDLKMNSSAYEFPLVYPPNVKKVWALRKAGLGLLMNLKGDAKPVTCIEDTAVQVEDLPNYIAEFADMMKKYGQRAVYYAHAGAGELHLRPILNLKNSEDVKLFQEISQSTAELVKKYNASLSGEHGDGRVRAPFIPLMIGEKNYALLQRIKKTWDPKNIFNPNKIVDTPAMTEDLRYKADQETRTFKTIFDFSETEGILRAAEKCNGSGDCRKLPLAGGTMCPSYMATRNERDTTRARANVLREFLTRSNKVNPFNHKEIYEVMDLCLSCKGCTSECPSNVDMTTLKAEFLHQYYQENGVPLRAKAIANIGKLNQLGAVVPSISNFFLGNSFTSTTLKKALGIATERSLPRIYKITWQKWFKQWKQKAAPLKRRSKKGQVYLFCDEFTNFNDVEIGIHAVRLLHRLGYGVEMVEHPESGRAYLSKGLLLEAQELAKKNVAIFKELISDETPLLGIEPSAILGFRDEYPKLVEEKERSTAKKLAKNVFLVTEFINNEMINGKITIEQFTEEKRHILLHGHCHQKALTSIEPTVWALSLPKNHTVEVIPSGCCGMAGSFGYEAEHYKVSMQIGELVLFPAVRKADEETLIAAPGTSCRHQIWDGTKRKALHPITILLYASKFAVNE